MRIFLAIILICLTGMAAFLTVESFRQNDGIADLRSSLAQQEHRISELKAIPTPTPMPSAKGSVIADRSDWGKPTAISSCPLGTNGLHPNLWRLTEYATVQNVGGDGVVNVCAEVFRDLPCPNYQWAEGMLTTRTCKQVYLQQGEEKEIPFQFWVSDNWRYSITCP